MIRRTILWGVLLALCAAACDSFGSQDPPTPIYVTATSQQFIIVTNTPTPSPSPVLAPTLPGTGVAEERATASSPVPTASATIGITLTPTFTPTPTDTPATPGAFIGPVGGIVAAQTGTACTTLPEGAFGQILAANPDLAAQIGCPLGTSLTISNAYQTYERGAMIWVSSVGLTGGEGIYTIFANGTYQRFADTWLEGIDPVGLGAAPPAGLVEPIRGFGKIWRESPGVSDGLGWASSGEQGGSGLLQTFERGEMISVPQTGQVYILVSGQPGTWTSLAANS